MNATKMVSSAPPPKSDSSGNNKKHEKQPRMRQKTVKVKCGISEHDLNIKMSHICEWLQKGYHVSVLISKNVDKPEVTFGEIVSVDVCTCGIFVVSFLRHFGGLGREL